MAEKEEELKSVLIKVKEESEKADFVLSIQKAKIMATRPINSWQIEGEKVEGMTDFLLVGSLWMVTAAIKLEDACFLEGKLCQIYTVYWKTDRSLRQKDPYSQSYGFSSSHVQMWKLNQKNWCFQIVVLEKTLESPLDSQEIQPVNPKGNQPWIFIGKTGDEAEAPKLWSPDSNSWHIGKDPDARKGWRQKLKGAREDKMVRQHYRLNGHESVQTPGDSEGQGNLVCCRPWGYKE